MENLTLTQRFARASRSTTIGPLALACAMFHLSAPLHPAQAQTATPPLAATIFFPDPPPRAVFGASEPIPVILQVEALRTFRTVEDFSRDDYRRYTIVTGPDGVFSTPVPGPRFHRHSDARLFDCSAQGGATLDPAVPVALSEIVPGPPQGAGDPEAFVLEFLIVDLRGIITFGSGPHRVQVRIPVLEFSNAFPCDDVTQEVIDLRSPQQFTVASNTLEFVSSLLTFDGFGPPLVNDADCAAPPCRSFNFGSDIPVKFKLFDDSGELVQNETVGFRVVQISGDLPSTPFPDHQVFRFDDPLGNYIFNLDTGLLALGVWQAEAILEDGSIYSVQFELR